MSFKKGISNSGNGGGRPKGARNRLSKAFVDALAADFEQHGEAVIKILRSESPSDYCRLVAGLVPKELDLEVTNRTAEVAAWMSWVVEARPLRVNLSLISHDFKSRRRKRSFD